MSPGLLRRFEAVRARTVSLCAPLSSEDAQLQSMPDASPAKWHLAHTTWFFETFALAPIGIPPIDPAFAFLFNSYYEAAGPRVDRARRGLVSRPSLAEVAAYRAEVDRRVAHAIVEERADAGVVELGLHHEQQHQELILTDLKHALATQPLRPAYRADLVREPRCRGRRAGVARARGWCPRDRRRRRPASRSTTSARGIAWSSSRSRSRRGRSCNAEVLAFIADGGYRQPELWLSDGWATVQREQWTAPLYWERAGDGAWTHYDLAGVREVDPAETACHLSAVRSRCDRARGRRAPAHRSGVGSRRRRGAIPPRATSPTTIACTRASRATARC